MTRLKYERQRRRLSQGALAKHASTEIVRLQQWHVSLMERGILIPTEAQRLRLEAVLEASDLLARVVIIEQVAVR